MDAERNKLAKADPEKIKTLQAQLDAAIEKANGYVIPNLYPQIIEENGGVGMNANTGEDSTDYFYNFPANRVELWFYLDPTLPASCVPRILQGAQRGPRRAPHAYRIRSPGQALRTADRHGY